MSIESKRKITVDVNNSKYIKVEAKQNDINSRYLVVALACNGKAIEIDPENHSAFVRMRKPDGYGVFNACAIEDNNIVIALTEQMLAKAGVCDLDIMLVENAEVEMVDGTINVLSGTILSSMLIHIDIIASALNNSTIESSYEYDALNQLMIETTAKYEMIKDYSKQYSDLAKEYSEEAEGYKNDTLVIKNQAITDVNAIKTQAISDTNTIKNQAIASCNSILSATETVKSETETLKNQAKASELLALQYKNEAFSGTPEGYEALVGKVAENEEGLKILDSDYATSLELDTAEGGLGVNSIKGQTVKSNNLWNEKWELGGINSNTGENETDSTRIRAKDLISIYPSTAYAYVSSVNNRVAYYGADKSYLGERGGWITVNANTVFVTPRNAYYMRIVLVNTTSYKYDTAIFEGNEVKPYEPYGLISSGSFALMDMGTLNWFEHKGAYCVDDFANNIKDYLNVYIKEYPRVYTPNIDSMPDYSYYVNNTNKLIAIKDTRYTSVSDFKSAMNGVLLAYEMVSGSVADKYALVVKEHNEDNSKTNLTIIPLSAPLNRHNGMYDEIIKQNGKWGVLRKFGYDNLERLNWNLLEGIWICAFSGYVYRGNTAPINAIADNYTIDTGDRVYLKTVINSIGGVGGDRLDVYNGSTTERPSGKFVYELATPYFEPFADQSVMYQLESYDTKTYVTTAEGLAELSVRYGKSDVAAMVLLKDTSETEVYDWAKQPTKPSYTKAEVGLGNVDNTADASKSVLYATSAGSVTGSNKVIVSDTAPSDTSAIWIK